MKNELENGQVRVEDVIAAFVERLNQDHLDLEPNTALDQDDLDHIDLLAEHECILYIDILQRASPVLVEDDQSRNGAKTPIQEYL